MIHIGNQTAFSAATPTEPFDYAVANGFDAFEWFPDKKGAAGWDESDLDRAERAKLRDLACARGIRLSVHARWQADPLQPESKPLLWTDLELARDLGAVLLNIHLYHEHGLPAFVEAILPLAQQATEAGLSLAIENTPDHPPELFNELFERLRGLDPKLTNYLGMCLDIGHANLCAPTRNNYLQFLDRLSPHLPIIHLHLHENWGDFDSHLPLFAGPSARDDAGVRGLMERLRRRNFSGSIILEQWPQPPSLLNLARDRLLEMLDGQRAHRTLSESKTPDQGAGRITPAGDSASDFVSELVAADQRSRSWREKLDWICGLLAQKDPPVTEEQLVALAIYLRFLGTGEIQCVEDGRHFRPAHHARTALQIQERLERLTTPGNAFVVRRIYPWLPSTAEPFQRAEPLTRIRDIAHRNDIPSDLKREIKTTLQNKLHRCAGPEDLATSTALLKRITAPGADYAPAFVEQFRIFHEELTEFFNARSLDERLTSLKPRMGCRESGLIESFLQQKAGAGLSDHLQALNTLTELRRTCLATVRKRANPEVQEFRLADIGLEDYAFVLLSKLTNGVETELGRKQLQLLLDSVRLAVTNLGLSSVAPEECSALDSELRAWSKDLAPVDREQLLRLKATTDRCRRLAEDHSERVLALFPPRVEQLGRALGIPKHAIRVFSEAEVRGHLVFPLSRLTACLLTHLRKELALPPWDVLVSGHAVGRLKSLRTLADLKPNLAEPVLALLVRAEGDEEIPSGIAGIVLGHKLAHLSHLGVRARQVGVVFVACDEPSVFESLRALDGQVVLLTATPERVSWIKGEHSAPVRQHSPAVRIPTVRLNPEWPCVELERLPPACGGGKAEGAKSLAELTRRAEAGFKTPAALVVPFGVMEAALQAVPALEAEYKRLAGKIDHLDCGELEAASEALRNLIRSLSVPDEITKDVRHKFGRQDRLMVRSSANCEDLAELAGAGLYESVANVAPAEVDSAVREVWASLWTRRAALSRKEAGIPHLQAHMAVLIQQMLKPDLSFVLHTVNPVNYNTGEIYAELAVGLGETLASGGVRGNPYRLVYEKKSGLVRMLAFANFSQALYPDAVGAVLRQTIDYSRIEFSRDIALREDLGRRLAAIARLVEEAFQGPQDIEGAVVGSDIYLVQARPQQGLRAR